MANLSEYISNMLKQGYNIITIKNWLIKKGYSSQIVDQAIYNLNQRQVKHTVHFSKSAVFVILILVVGLGAGTYFFFGGSNSKPGKLLDVSINNVFFDGDVSGSIDLTNMGSSGSYDVYIKYELINAQNNNRITFESETVALQTTLSRSFEFRENLNPGNYIVKITARFEDSVAVASKQFNVGGEDSGETCFDNILNQDEEDVDCGGICPECKKCPESCDDGDPNTIDYCSNYECVNNRPSVCGDNICGQGENENSCPDDCIIIDKGGTIWDDLEEIKNLAKTNPGLAEERCDEFDDSFRDQCLEDVGSIAADLKICDKITDEYFRDRCFSNVAKSINKYAVCENIKKESRRDSCYMNFVIDGEYGICDRISNQYLRKSCETLAQTQ